MPISRVVILLLAVSTMAVAACTRPPLQSDDPDVQAAQEVCQDVSEVDRFACVALGNAVVR